MTWSKTKFSGHDPKKNYGGHHSKPTRETLFKIQSYQITGVDFHQKQIMGGHQPKWSKISLSKAVGSRATAAYFAAATLMRFMSIFLFVLKDEWGPLTGVALALDCHRLGSVGAAHLPLSLPLYSCSLPFLLSPIQCHTPLCPSQVLIIPIYMLLYLFIYTLFWFSCDCPLWLKEFCGNIWTIWKLLYCFGPQRDFLNLLGHPLMPSWWQLYKFTPWPTLDKSQLPAKSNLRWSVVAVRRAVSDSGKDC